jgi:hypothetical protein
MEGRGAYPSFDGVPFVTNGSQIFHSKNEEEVSFAPAVEQQEKKERDGH